jgi:hypothetical protein
LFVKAFHIANVNGDYGDGWMGAGSSSTAGFIREYTFIRRFLDEAGRDPATFMISKRVYYKLLLSF